jgi:hypothetical protein
MSADLARRPVPDNAARGATERLIGSSPRVGEPVHIGGVISISSMFI